MIGAQIVELETQVPLKILRDVEMAYWPINRMGKLECEPLQRLRRTKGAF